jgi:hypothetical protein
MKSQDELEPNPNWIRLLTVWCVSYENQQLYSKDAIIEIVNSEYYYPFVNLTICSNHFAKLFGDKLDSLHGDEIDTKDSLNSDFNYRILISLERFSGRIDTLYIGNYRTLDKWGYKPIRSFCSYKGRFYKNNDIIDLVSQILPYDQKIFIY